MSDEDRRLASLQWRLDRLERAAIPPGVCFQECGDFFQNTSTGKLYSWDDLAILIDRGVRLVFLPANSVTVDQQNDYL